MEQVSEKGLRALKAAVAFEGTPECDKALGWRWYEVSASAGVLNSLVTKELLRISFKSRSSTHYLLTDKGRALAEGTLKEVTKQELVHEPVDMAGVFSDIVGYDDVKELLRESLQLEKPIHVLLHGPPSLAKSMFLWDIEQVFGEMAVPLLGSATSHAGLWDLVAERKPKVILVDELEKMTLTDIAGLLSIMQTGRIIRAKVGRKLDEKVNAWVIAAANRIQRLPPELLSRFAKFQLGEYNSSEFVKVVKSVLVQHENTEDEDSHEIAMRLVGRTHDVRDAVRVARLAKRVGVKRAVELLLR